MCHTCSLYLMIPTKIIRIFKQNLKKIKDKLDYCSWNSKDFLLFGHVWIVRTKQLAGSKKRIFMNLL